MKLLHLGNVGQQIGLASNPELSNEIHMFRKLRQLRCATSLSM